MIETQTLMATILVIDDDQYVVNLLKYSLEEAGYRVLPGYDGQMAIQLARTYQPHLAILDVNMPLLNGIKTLEYLRKSPETAIIPVLFLSGARSDLVYPAVMADPRATFIKKPIDLIHIHSLIGELLQKYKVGFRAADPTLQFRADDEIEPTPEPEDPENPDIFPL
jgi:DNA-binding response OmpR family regulator